MIKIYSIKKIKENKSTVGDQLSGFAVKQEPANNVEEGMGRTHSIIT